jgi:hypothetical protein
MESVRDGVAVASQGIGGYVFSPIHGGVVDDFVSIEWVALTLLQ